MDGKVDISDLGGKIELLLRSDSSEVKMLDDMLRRIGMTKDYWSRIKSGTRTLPDDRFVELCKCFGIPQKDFYTSLNDFGAKLGFSRRQIAEITQTPMPGIDFMSRIRDPDRVGHLFAMLEGFWESFYFSVSKEDKALVSLDVMWVKRVDEDLFIEVVLDDTHFRYVGWCVPIMGQLYFIMEKKDLLNEIIVYATHYPDRNPPTLCGIILCTSGGVHSRAAYPSAARVAFRYIGSSDAQRKKYGITNSEQLFEYLVKKHARYVDPAEPDLDAETRSIIREIRNVITEDAVPLALRMEDVG